MGHGNRWTLELARPAGRKMPTLAVAHRHELAVAHRHELAVAHRHEIAGAGIEAILQAGGHSVIARCSHEDELLRFVEAHRPDRERYGLGNGNDLYLLYELRAVHHPSYHMLLRWYGMAASSPNQPLVHHCRELPVGDLRL
jgi:hypothetical protein